MNLAKFPKRLPNDIPEEVRQEMLSRPRHCARILQGVCTSPCQPLDEDGEYQVECEHVVPRAEGGTNDSMNLQWLCSVENRRKWIRTDSHYDEDLYFDAEIDTSKLRKHQYLKGYALAAPGGEYAAFFADPEKIQRTLRVFLLVAWMVGAGKTVGMMSILHAINRTRIEATGTRGCRRIKRVLWLAHQTMLTDSLTREIKEEMHGYGICARKPLVAKVTNADDWSRDADVIVATPQSLWDDKAKTLTDRRRREILAKFDAIVIDEAQFAVDRYHQICELAPNAFKFCVTATPMDTNGRFFSEIDKGAYRGSFRIFSTFDVKDGRSAGIYKDLAPFADGKADGLYVGEYNEAEKYLVSSASGVRSDLAILGPIIRKAMDTARALDAQTGYDNLVMFRVGSIEMAKAVAEVKEMGGEAVAVYMGDRLPSLGSLKHPFMKILTTRSGRIPDGGKRAVVCVNLGQIGLNNRYISTIAWLQPSFSWIEIIQRIGRAIRGTGTANEAVRLLWIAEPAIDASGRVKRENGAIIDEFAQRLEKCIAYMIDASSILEGKFDALNEEMDPDGIKARAIDSSIPQDIRGQTLRGIGQKIIGGVDPYDVDIDTLVPPTVPIDLRGKVVEYIDRVLKTPTVMVPGMAPLGNPVRVVSESDVRAEYTDAEVTEALRTCRIMRDASDETRDLIVRLIAAGNREMLSAARSELVRADEKAKDEMIKAFDKMPSDVLKSGDHEEGSVYRRLVDILSPHYVGGGFAELQKRIFPVMHAAAAARFGVGSISVQHLRKEYGEDAPRKIAFAMTSIVIRKEIVQEACRIAATSYASEFPTLSALIERLSDRPITLEMTTGEAA